MVKKGKVAEGIVASSLRYMEDSYNNFMWGRLYDTSDMRMVRCERCGSYTNTKVMAKRQVADFWALWNGQVAFIEVKSSRDGRRYNLSWIRDGQIEMLKKAMVAGAKSCVIIVKRAIGRVPVLYLVSPLVLAEYNRASITWDELEIVGERLEKIENKVYRLEKIWTD